MRVKELRIKNFRNYREEEVRFSGNRNIIVGKNAQGKTNLLEAIEYVSRGKSPRTANDFELISTGAPGLEIELDFQSRQGEESISVSISKNSSKVLKSGGFALEKKIKVNGTKYNSTRKLAGNFVTVSFKSEDLNLLRGGPKHRRDWIDQLGSTLKRTYSADLSKYTRTITQKNRLLKTLFEKGSASPTDMEELKTWNQQAALLGARVVKQRMETLENLLPLCKKEHSNISGKLEELSVEYFLNHREEDEEEDMDSAIQAGVELDENDIARRLYRLFKKRSREEIVRKQSLSGPHRDDLKLLINGKDATAYASQGQQRSLVLSLKLAELSLVKDHIMEPPVLLLDDVLAELDLSRQSHLMQACDQDMQTLITTTHVDAFERKWLENAQFIEVEAGTASIEQLPGI